MSAFYRDYLGYEEPCVLNRLDGTLQMVIMKVNERQVILLLTDVTKILPNGDNLDHYLDLLAYDRKPGSDPARRVPEFCLEVPDVAKAAALLTTGAKTLGFPPPAPMSLSTDGRRQTSCVDPDGVRLVLREAAWPR